MSDTIVAKRVEATTVVAEKIVLSSANGEHKLTLQSTDNGVGLWLEDKESGTTITLCSGFRSGSIPYLAMFNRNDTPHQFGLFLDKDGSTLIQLMVKGEPKTLNLTELLTKIQENEG